MAIPNSTIVVVKRDRSKEPFNPSKIQQIAVAAGLHEDEAKALTKEISLEIVNLNKKLVSYKEIRDMVFTSLQKINLYAANMYSWYEKIKHRDERLQGKQT